MGRGGGWRRSRPSPPPSPAASDAPTRARQGHTWGAGGRGRRGHAHRLDGGPRPIVMHLVPLRRNGALSSEGSPEAGDGRWGDVVGPAAQRGEGGVT